MNNNKVLLTIAIPTYNRQDSLLRQVRILIPQLSPEVELIIVDNCSSIPACTLFGEDEKKHLKFYKNQFNIGADGNIASCFLRCKSSWLWILSDDDFLTDWAVEYVLDTIRRHKDSSFINFHFKYDFDIMGFDDFVSKCDVNLYSNLFWMSVCVYNIEKLAPYMHYYFPAISTMQPSVVLLIRALIKDPSTVLSIVNKNLFSYKDPTTIYNVSWSRSSFIYSSLFVFDLLRDIENSKLQPILSSIVSECYAVIRRQYEMNKEKKEALSLFKAVIKKRGFYRIMVGDFKPTISTLLCIIR